MNREFKFAVDDDVVIVNGNGKIVFCGFDGCKNVYYIKASDKNGSPIDDWYNEDEITLDES